MFRLLKASLAFLERVVVDIEDEWGHDVEDHEDCQEEEDTEKEARPKVIDQHAVDVRRIVPIIAYKHNEEGQHGRVGVVEVEEVVECTTDIANVLCFGKSD